LVPRYKMVQSFRVLPLSLKLKGNLQL
jgi:hypothetical protein